jgi:sulfur-carrier protein
MPRVAFTQNLLRHVACPPQDVPGSSVREALEAVFQTNAAPRGYVLDEHGELRKHVTIFINGEPIRDRAGLTDPVPTNGEIYVFQALSGG